LPDRARTRHRYEPADPHASPYTQSVLTMLGNKRLRWLSVRTPTLARLP
jgi:hypothetical protein